MLCTVHINGRLFWGAKQFWSAPFATVEWTVLTACIAVHCATCDRRRFRFFRQFLSSSGARSAPPNGDAYTRRVSASSSDIVTMPCVCPSVHTPSLSCSACLLFVVYKLDTTSHPFLLLLLLFGRVAPFCVCRLAAAAECAVTWRGKCHFGSPVAWIHAATLAENASTRMIWRSL